MKPATLRALRLLDARGADGLTDAEYHAATGFWRLAARVGEIRAALGEGAVETVYERTADGQSRYARYYRRRPAVAPMRGVQTDLFGPDATVGAIGAGNSSPRFRPLGDDRAATARPGALPG